MEARTGSSMGVCQTLAFSVDVSLKKKKKQRLVYETIIIQSPSLRVHSTTMSRHHKMA